MGKFGLDGIHFKVAVFGFSYPPFQYHFCPIPPNSRPIKPGCINGTDIALVQVLATILNFSVSFIAPPLTDQEQNFGLCEGTRCTGALGLVQRGEADFSARVFVMSEQRKALVDFGPASLNPYDGWAFLTRKFTLHPDAKILIAPFSSMTWLVFALSCFVVWTFLWGLQVHVVDTAQKAARFVKRFGRNAWIGARIALQQGDDSRNGPLSGGHKLLILVWMVATFIVVQMYVAKMFSIFSVRRISRPFSDVPSLTELIRTGEATFVMIQDETLKIRQDYYNFLRDPYESLGAVFNEKNVVFTRDNNERVELLQQKAKLYVSHEPRIQIESAIIGPLSEYSKCELEKVEDRDFKQTEALIFRKNFSSFEQLNRAISSLTARTYDYITIPYVQRLKSQCIEVVSRVRTIEIGDVLGTFFVWLIGLGIGILALSGEKMAKLLTGTVSRTSPAAYIQEETRHF